MTRRRPAARFLMTAAALIAVTLSLQAGRAAEAPMAPAAPPAEMKQLDFLVGTWKVSGTFSGEMAGELSGQVTVRPIGGGFFLLRESTTEIRAQGVPDPITGEDLTVIRYDTAAKQFALDAYDSGPGFKGIGTMDKSAFVMSFPPEPGALPGGFRVTVKPDGRNALQSTAELSDDGGKTWTTVLELKYTRVPAPK